MGKQLKQNIGAWLEQCIKQQLFQSLPLHTGPSLNCPGETAELWQNAIELASGKDLNTFKGPNTQVPATLYLSKQIVSQLLYKYVWLTQILQALLLGACVGRLLILLLPSGIVSRPCTGEGYRRKVTSLLLDPTKEGRSRRGPAPRDGIDLLEFYTIYSHNN